jgi:indolepyruvate ferredoxin oxidoreductase
VARLYTDPQFAQRIRAQFTGDFKMHFHLAPPGMRGRDAAGRPKKRRFGPWVMLAYKMLRPMKVLRGTPFDFLGYSHERRRERLLIEEYRVLVEGIVGRLEPHNLEAAIEIARAAYDIGGYGPVKEASIERYDARLPGLLAAFEGQSPNQVGGEPVTLVG